jgi:bifunctional non-homologous end joining protein LigD
MKARPSKTQVLTKIGGKSLALTNLDKILWPADGYTKGDLIAYYRAVAKWILPYLKDRPLSLERYPNGVTKPGFFEKNAPQSTPPWVRTVTLDAGGKRERVRYIVCDNEATLAYVANLASIALHVWMSRTGSLDAPDFILFDLDRGEGCSLKTLATVALALATELRARKMKPLAKTTGGSGMHVFVWLRGGYSYERAREFTQEIALALQAKMPKLITVERRIAKRPRGTVYMDWVQVGRGKTVVMPFVVRPRAKAPVSMPLAWTDVQRMERSSEVDTASYFARWNLGNAPAMLQRKGDPWKARSR